MKATDLKAIKIQQNVGEEYQQLARVQKCLIALQRSIQLTLITLQLP